MFEEPEAFLHPTQQELLNLSLHDLSSVNQILISTHSTTFVSKNVEDLTSIIKVAKEKGISSTKQLSDTIITDILKSNTGLYRLFSAMLTDPSVSPTLQASIKEKKLGEAVPDLSHKLNEESFRVFSLA